MQKIDNSYLLIYGINTMYVCCERIIFHSFLKNW